VSKNVSGTIDSAKHLQLTGVPGRPSLGGLAYANVRPLSARCSSRTSGAALALKDPEREGTPGSELTRVDYRSPGLAVLAVGGVGVVIGGSLLVADLVLRRDTKVSVAPTLNGIAIAGRF